MTVVAGLTVVLVLVNIVLVLGNRTIQNEVNARQQFINQTMVLERLNREIITTLADLAVRNNNDELRNPLAEHGIIFTVNPVPAGPTKAQR